jgi:tripartite-type tricarboxylate transporter receptor subunit TctC
MRRVLMALLGFAAVVAFVAQGRAETVADFYKGKTITLLVGYSPGGAYDAVARLVARHMGQ